MSKLMGFMKTTQKRYYKFEKKVDVEKLNKDQWKKLCGAIAVIHAMNDVTVSFTNVTMESPDLD